ncbi:MAG: C25 family cysteine peptidase, partial [Desulfobacteraceae bacterium]|nr:C25 family cysteine peptidase [Desulfobacteraceae bacterium]
YGANHTDYYYSTGKGPEPADSPLVFPFLALGRIPVKPDAKGRDSHAVSVIKKIIDYEKKPLPDSAYYKRMVFASSFENVPNTGTPPGHETRGCMEASEYVCSRLENEGYQIKRVYLTNIPDATLYYSDHTVIQQPVRGQIKYSRAANNAADATEALKKALAQGQLFVSYRGHGGSCEWSFPSLSGDDVDKVPACPPSAVFSLCCNTGMFTASQPCLADMFLAMNGGGVPSLIASTTESDAAMNNDFIKALFDGAFGNILSLRHPMTRKIRRIGDLMNYAKKCIPLLRRDADTLIRDHFEVYHVIGDPTLELWTEPPLWFAVTAFLEEDELKIRLEPCPPECRVTLRSGLEVMARVNPLTGEATVVPREGVKFGAAANHVTVCCWAPGYLYNEVKLPIPGK